MPWKLYKDSWKMCDAMASISGSCDYGFQWQTLRDADFRRYLRIKPKNSGVLVIVVDDASEVKHVLKPVDIVTQVDGVSISSAGTIRHESGERVSFHALVASKFVCDQLALEKEVVIISQVLHAQVNGEFEKISDERVMKVNGENVKCLKSFS